ncbi:hypothetical protein [Actinomadura sp. HBU206391]|uniref:hypothetical protein n=1 Tax=Actinomadura sp. HBU206391 TaxID=2731692 RepID=UPI00164FF34D|nr:hypothetical protein [Actinomadura sp. HBU206391]MBC6457856.1 hypothetical protein [Actinomadura sp. HBU206391]
MSLHPADEPFSALRPLRPLDVRQGFHEIAHPPQGLWSAMPTTLAAVDITAFGDHRRDDDAQLHLRQAMYECLVDAFSITRLPWAACHREDRGDGVLIVTPPDVPAEALLDPLAHHLHAGLRRHNRLASETGRLRLRAAVHSGRVHRDLNGVAGHAALHLFRLLEAAAFKKAFNTSGADLGLIVSDGLYRDASRHGGLINPAAYQRLRVSCKETRAWGWLWLPPAGR